ncbi:MAG: TIGR03915 family putative DNA repair protein [Clostridiales bacterium]|jgi:probable DNA metabolism protein|nr:TIGR03915 family putative DNA repair protein [Clostridiales bacterium]
MDRQGELIVTFDGSFDGLLTVVYNRFYENLRPDFISKRGNVQQRLDSQITDIETDFDKSAKVYEGIASKISPGAIHTVYYASLKDDAEIYTKIYRYILLGFKVHGDINNYLKEDYVLGVLKAAKTVGREANFLREFIRFKETKDGILYGEISPESNCLGIVAHHFADRFLGLKWIIADKKRDISAVSGGEGFILTDDILPDIGEFADKEENLIALWKMFHKTIANESRVNPKLQTQLLPKRYRKHMTEFQIDFNLPD